MTEEVTEGRNRRDDVITRPLSPDSLCGSWFHKLDEGEYVEQGLVVAEVQPGIYQLEIDDWFTGDPLYQRLQHVDGMTGRTDDVEWRFYDTREKMRAAYYRAQARNRVDAQAEQEHER